MTITITDMTGAAPGKLAEAELHFDARDGVLCGLKLVGFAIWERRGGGGRNVTLPARQYAINGERRTFALLRPRGVDDVHAPDNIRTAILDAYQAQLDAAESC
jgi:hypothetical protein